MPDLSSFLSILSPVLAICILIGGFFAFRSGYSNATTETQAKLIETLKVQIETLEKQVAHDTKEITRLKSTVITIQKVLGQRGMTITVDDESVTLKEDMNKQTISTTTVQITSSQTTP